MTRIGMMAAAFGAVLLLAAPAKAEEQNVRLAVEMDCPSCNFIVASVLKGTEGVMLAEWTEFDVIKVTFDDKACSVEQLVAALKSNGFMPQVLGSEGS